MSFELEDGEDILIDARGHRCPTPTLRLRRASEAAGKGSVMVLLADDPMAPIDVAHFSAGSGLVLLELRGAGSVLRFRLRKPA